MPVDLGPKCVAHYKFNSDLLTEVTYNDAYEIYRMGDGTAFYNPVDAINNTIVGDMLTISFPPGYEDIYGLIGPHIITNIDINANLIFFNFAGEEGLLEAGQESTVEYIRGIIPNVPAHPNNTHIVKDSQEYSTGMIGHYPFLAGSEKTVSQMSVNGKVNGAFKFVGTIPGEGGSFIGGDYILLNKNFLEILSNSFSLNWWEYSISWRSSLFAYNIVAAGINAAAGIDVGKNWLSMGYVKDGQTPHTFVAYDTSQSLLNVWNMFTITLDKTSETSIIIKLFQNNQLLLSYNVNDFSLSDWSEIVTAGIGDTTLAIGYYSYTPGNLEFTNGYLDNLMFFNAVLSTDEIAFLYNSGNGTEELTDIVESEEIFDYE
jgi:hypothetical protein